MKRMAMDLTLHSEDELKTGSRGYDRPVQLRKTAIPLFLLPAQPVEKSLSIQEEKTGIIPALQSTQSSIPSRRKAEADYFYKRHAALGN